MSAFLDKFLGHKTGLWFNYFGTLSVLGSTAFAKGNGVASPAGQMYPFVVLKSLILFLVGIWLLGLGFTLQNLEAGSSLQSRLVNALISFLLLTTIMAWSYTKNA